MPKRIDDVPQQRERVQRAPVGKHVPIAGDRYGHAAIEQSPFVERRADDGAHQQSDLARRRSGGDRIGNRRGDERGLIALVLRAIDRT